MKPYRPFYDMVKAVGLVGGGGSVGKSPATPMPPTYTGEEVWTAEEQRLWREASVSERRAALSLRWMLRAHVDPISVPLSRIPVCAVAQRKELLYRAESQCRGVVRDD